MRSMQMVAPQLKELQRKYKGNRQKLNEELMAFYKENEINPFASCLPLVAQLPIFIALYYVLKSFAKDATVSGGSVSFMWLIPDVRNQLQDIGWGAFVIVAIYALSQLLSTELSATPNMPDSQRRIMRFLPLVVVIFVFQFPVPSGLVLYWMTTNLWTGGQQLVMRHRIGLHLADPAEVEKVAQQLAGKKGSRTAPKRDGRPRGGRRRAATTPRKRRSPRRNRRRRRRRARRAPEDNGDAGEAPEARPSPDGAPEPESPRPRGAGPRAANGCLGQPAAPAASEAEGRRQGLAPGGQLALQEEEALTGGERWGR